MKCLSSKFKLIVLISTLLVLAGCSATSTRPNTFQYLNGPDTILLQQEIESGTDVNEKDLDGRTLLHHAIRYTPAKVPFLLENGASVNVQDKYGLTPVHVAVLFNPQYIAQMLLLKPDLTLKTSSAVGCYGLHRTNMETRGLTAFELAEYCQKNDAIDQFQLFAQDTLVWKETKEKHTREAYQAYLDSFHKPLFSEQAKKQINILQIQYIEKLKSDAKCELAEADWYYISGECKDGKADGQGVAVTADYERFEGLFKNGWRSKGKHEIDYELMYDGEFLGGQYHGFGICVYEGEFEECRMYRGKRIDSLYVQRKMMMTQFDQLRSELKGINQSVARAASASRSSGTSKKKYDYLLDLNSKNKHKRTSAQIQAALDLFQFFMEESSK